MNASMHGATPDLNGFRDEAIAKLLGAIAHDLNNALAQVILTTGWLAGGEADAIRRESLNDIEESAGRASLLTDELIEWSKSAHDGALPFLLSGLLPALVPDPASVSESHPTPWVRLREPLWPVYANPTEVAARISDALSRAPSAVVRVYNVAPHIGLTTLADDSRNEPMVCVSVTSLAYPVRDTMRRQRVFIPARPHSVLAGRGTPTDV